MDETGAASDVADYRMAPDFAVRIVGLGLVVLAVLLFLLAIAVASLGWPADVLVIVAGVGVVGVVTVASWLRSRAYVVRLTPEGYHVRFVRGAGVTRGLWTEVADAAIAHPRDVPCVVLTRHDDTTTSIPVVLIAADRDAFANDVRARLDAAAR